MKRSLFAICLALPLAAPLHAQEAVPDAPETDDGFSLIEEGAKLMLKGFMSEMEPALDDMGDALREAKPYLDNLGPQFAELLEIMGDIRNYDKPVVLPNGDILIRRKADAPPVAPVLPGPGPNGEIEL